MKKNKIFGIILILFAVYLVGKNLDIFPVISLFDIAITLLMLYFVRKGIKARKFSIIIPCLSIIYIIYDDFIYDHLISSTTLESFDDGLIFIIALLVGLGIDMILKDSSLPVNEKTSFTSTSSNLNANHFKFSNTCGEVSKYVTSDRFDEGLASNSFGAMNIYMDNVTVTNNAKLDIKNSFGQTNIYLPADIRISIDKNCSFGTVKVNGSCTDSSINPLLQVNINNSFGEVNIFFK